MKIRIFALAKELGLGNKEVIDLCSRAGINVKNSALASVTPEERDAIVAFLNAESSDAPPPEPEVPTTALPSRDPALRIGRVRSIRTMTPRPHHGSDAPGRVEDPPQPVAPEVAPEPVVAPAVSDERSPQESQVEVVAEAVAAEAVAVEDESTESGSAEVDSVEVESTKAADAVGDTEDVEVAAESEPVGRQADARPLRREDYVSATGGTRPLREMKPIGSVQDSESRESRRTKARPSLPTIAAPPEYRPPVVRTRKPDEGPAQKPDMPLTAEAFTKASPLADRLERKKREDATEDEHPGRQSGLLEKRRREKASLVKELADSRAREAQNRKMSRRSSRKKRPGSVELKSSAEVELPITVRALSEAMGRPARSIIQYFFRQGRPITINEILNEDEAFEIALELGVELEIKRGRDIEAELADAIDSEGPDEELCERPPIVTILGHVDHGKTTLVDKIRAANVAAGEAGGITQHIAAYQVDYHGKKITFVDTPGHAAFGEMRARGANVTDLVVLVVAADDGVMPQTVECISHAKAAGVPIVVAMNKCDLPDIDEQKVLQGLAAQELLPAEWSGDTEVVRTSGITGKGVDDLLEVILIQAELTEFKVNPNRPALGVCLESFRDEGRGVVAWLIVQKGTLRIGDIVVCGGTYGRIRAMYNDRNEAVEEAGPSTPVKVAGLNEVPGAGNHFFVMSDVDEAREVVNERLHQGRTEVLSRRGKPRTLEDIFASRDGGGVQDLPLVVKADSPGSLEALRGEITKFEHPEVRVQIIHEGVGGVNESDVYLASASGAIIIAFHVVPEDRAEVLAVQEAVQIRRYDIIYEVTDHIKQALEGLLRPERVEVTTGRALVLRTFQISRFGTIAGCRVLSGTIARDNRLHVIRDQKVLNDYRIASLKREKEDAKDVRDGMECGIRLEGFNDVKEGDLLEAFRVDEVQRKLE